jgi:hypothetical protein
MFQGNEKLKIKYGKISEGYKKEVVPYRKDYFRQYKEGEISKQKFIDSLTNDYKIYSKHKTLQARNNIEKILGHKLTQGTLLGTGFLGGNYLMNKLLGKE